MPFSKYGMFIVPASLVLTFALLYFALRSSVDALLVMVVLKRVPGETGFRGQLVEAGEKLCAVYQAIGDDNKALAALRMILPHLEELQRANPDNAE